MNKTTDTVLSKTDLFNKDSTLADAIKNTTDSAPESVIGINFPFIVAIEWSDKKEKVHLYMKQKGSNSWCFYQTKDSAHHLGHGTKA
ncbi:MAG: hypothetical protein IPP37_05530 [Saprospiraceae bacterium]|nr:hypothetical protein [Saprospiraceae bacterium]